MMLSDFTIVSFSRSMAIGEIFLELRAFRVCGEVCGGVGRFGIELNEIVTCTFGKLWHCCGRARRRHG